jgi:hypothetical protein
MDMKRDNIEAVSRRSLNPSPPLLTETELHGSKAPKTLLGGILVPENGLE